MKMKKIIAAALALCMTLPVLASCDRGTVDNVRPDGEGSNINDSFPQADYGGEKFTFFTMTTKTSTSEYYCGEWIDAEDLNGTATNDAVYKRNRTCEEKYNIEIEEKLNKDNTGSMDELTQYYQAGDYCFDVVYAWGNRLGSVVTDSLFYDFNELQKEGYINMENNYWAPSTADDLTIAGRRFLAINDTTMSKLSWSSMMVFNPQIIKDLALEDPQELVKADKWTFDKFLEMVQSVHVEKDGDGTFTKRDQYGLIYSEYVPSTLFGLGVQCTNKADDGTYTLALGEEKTISLITKLKEMVGDTAHVMTANTIATGEDISGYDPFEYPRSYFAKGHALFMEASPELTREFKDMETGYGVLPMPKYNENQENYNSKIDSCAGMFAIPNTCRTDIQNSSFERTGRVLEYLGYLSSQEGSVVDAYYEVTIKGQRMTMEGNKEMLDIVKNNGRYDWTEIMGVGTIDVMADMYNKNPVSRFKASEQRLKKSLADTYAKFQNLD